MIGKGVIKVAELMEERSREQSLGEPKVPSVPSEIYLMEVEEFTPAVEDH
jgi:hypothetical protein